MKKTLGIIFILLFSFCSKKERSPYPHFVVEDVDSFLKLNTKEMIGVEPEVFGFNFTDDTNEKTHVYRVFEISPNKLKEKRKLYFGDMVLNENFIFPNTDSILPIIDLKVIVDTTYTIPRKNFHYINHIPNFNPKLINDEESELKLMKPFYDEERKQSKKWIECYPLLIYNQSKSNAVIEPLMIQEAKDETGKWRPIEFIEVGRGGPSCLIMPKRNLFSKRYLGSSIIKYQGNFKTKLRVKFVNQWNTYYSNEFTGYINKSQFDKKPFIEQYNFRKNPLSCSLQMSMDFAFLDYQKYKYSITIRP